MKQTTKDFVIVFFSNQLENFRSNTLKNITYQVLDPKKDIKIKYLLLTLFFIPKILINNIYILKEVSFLRFLRIIKLNFKCKAIALNLLKIKPKAVLTYVDNSPIVHLVCKYCPNIPFIGVQNGNRELFALTEELIHPSHKYYLDEYFCYGPKTKDIFLNNGQNKIKKYIFCGSFKEGIFFEKHYENFITKKPVHDLCLLSEWMTESSLMLKTKSWNKQISSVEKICSFLSDFIGTKNISLAIALRSSKSEEIEFYKQFFNTNVTFYNQSEDGFSSYNASCNSNVTVALYSALALEMIGAGIKVLYVNPYGHKNYAISDAKCDWYLHRPNINEFTERLQLLLKKDKSQFFSDNKKSISYINSFDYQKPMHKLLRKSILQKIDES